MSNAHSPFVPSGAAKENGHSNASAVLNRAPAGAGAALKPPPASKRGGQGSSAADDVRAMKKRLLSAALRAIKKTGHHRRKSPWSEIHDHVPSADDMSLLMEGHRPTSDTARMAKYVLLGGDVPDWLGCGERIEGVKFDGPLWHPRGCPPPRMKCVVSFLEAEIKFEKKTGSVTIKFHTLCESVGFA